MDRRDFIHDFGAFGLGALTAAPALAQAQTQGQGQGQESGAQAAAGAAEPFPPSPGPGPFDGVSDFDAPRLQHVFDIELDFTRVQNIDNMPTGAGRGAVYLDAGKISGPHLNGQAVPNSGGDYALFRPDNVLSFDARYMLQENDGSLILLHNRGYLWGRHPDTMERIRDWIFNDGPVVPESDYYLRAFPTFEVERGKHDWLMRYVIVGVGKRKEQGNIVRYYALL